MFELFTDRARRAIVLAEEEAHNRNHSYIGPEHILLGLIREGGGVAAQALSIESGEAMLALTVLVPDGPAPVSGPLPFTAQTKRVLELSLREALQLGHRYIGTEHVLLGLIREGEGVGVSLLGSLGWVVEDVRKAVMGILAGALPVSSREPCVHGRFESHEVTLECDPWKGSHGLPQ